MTLERAILEALDAARDGHPLSAKMLLGMILDDLPLRPTLSEIATTCERLETADFIVIQNVADRGKLCSITPKGIARARS